MPADPSSPRSSPSPVAAMPETVSRLLVLTLSLLLTVLIGWLLWIGKGLLMPIMIAVLSVYVIAASGRAMGRWRVTGWMSQWLRTLFLALGFMAVLAGFNWVVIVTVRDLVALAPQYQANLERLIAQVMALLGLEGNPNWEIIGAATFERIDMPAMMGTMAGSVGSMAGLLVLAAVYALFLSNEASGFSRKLSVALPGRGQARRTLELIEAINARIGEYLAVKTLINLIVGLISWVILKLFGVDHALFWALLIGLLNYIPYFGSLVAVTLPVGMAMVQFGALQVAVALAMCLTAVNMWVGNWLEPRMIGRRVNMSPFVVVAALSFWTTLWGLAGAILAVPMTSMVAIILAAFPQTRPLAVLVAQDVSEFDTAEAGSE